MAELSASMLHWLCSQASGRNTQSIFPTGSSGSDKQGSCSMQSPGWALLPTTVFAPWVQLIFFFPPLSPMLLCLLLPTVQRVWRQLKQICMIKVRPWALLEFLKRNCSYFSPFSWRETPALGYSGWQIRPEEGRGRPVPSTSRSWNNNSKKETPLPFHMSR